jgi:hypothetical protein
MDIRHCTHQDIKSINELMSSVHFAHINPHMINDTTLGAFDGSECFGFIWAGITESKFLAYVDFMAVKPGTSGIGTRLTQQMWSHLDSLGVIKVMSVVEYSGTDNEEKCLQLNAKLGMTPLAKPYHFCIGDIERDRSWAV